MCRAVKVKDQDVDEAHGKNEEVYSKGGVLHVEKKRFIILRDEEVGGLDMEKLDRWHMSEDKSVAEVQLAVSIL